MFNNFIKFIKGLFVRYYDQIVKDYHIILEFYDIKIVRPMQLKMWHYIKIYGIFKIIYKIVLIILFKIPIWWPFLFITYIWGLFLTYSFLPVVYWIEQQIYYKKNDIPVWFIFINYEKCLYWVLQIQWWLKTWLGLIHIMDFFYRWWYRLPRFIDYVQNKIQDKWAEVKRNSMRTDGAVDVWLRYIKNNHNRIKNTFYKYFWYAPKNFIFNWLNPHKYKLFRLIFYRNNRLRIYTWLYCRWLIRYKIFKGLVIYWIKSAIYMGGRRLLLRVKYLYKMIKIRCNIRPFYNKIVLKIRKLVYYVCRELIYIWTAISLLIEIVLIFFCKLIPLFIFISWIISKIGYIIIFLLNFWYYNVVYSYQWYQIWFIKGTANSIKALQIQKKLGYTAQKILSYVSLNQDKKFYDSVVYVTFIGKIKNNFKYTSNKVWKLWFGQEAILFIDKSLKPKNSINNKNNKSNVKRPIKIINENEDIWTKIWKSCCPPLWLKKPEDVNSPNSKFRVEIKAGIGKGKQKT